MLAPLLQRMRKHPVLISIAVCALVGGGVWYTQRPTPQPTRYLLAPVTRSTLIKTIQSSGQVLGQNQLDLKSAVSAPIRRVLVRSGQAVSSTTPLFELDPKEAYKTLRDASQAVADAKISYDSSALSLKKLKSGATAYEITQAEHDIRAQEQNVQLSSDGVTPISVRREYDAAVPIIKSTSQSLEQALYDADQILGIDATNANDAYERILSVLDSSKLAQAVTQYPIMKARVLTCKRDAESLRALNEDPVNVKRALATVQSCVADMGPFLEKVYAALVNTITSPTFTQSQLSALENTIQSDRSSMTAKLTTIVSTLQGLDQAQSSYEASQLTLTKLRTSLEHLKAGADPIDISIAENSLASRQSALATAQHRYADAAQALAEYTVRAPFDGTIANITAQVGDQASPSTALAILLTPTQLAQISLNEVDVASVHVGQKATLTFDAVPDLTIAGRVVEVDPLGTVTQGVVNYNVKIAFDSQDDRVKSGMSATVSVITSVHTDVLLVQNSAIKRQGTNVSVQTLSNPVGVSSSAQEGVTSQTPPHFVAVRIGASNDQETEIVSGLNEGDQVIIRTIEPATMSGAASTNSASQLRIPGITGGGGFGGGAVRGGAGR